MYYRYIPLSFQYTYSIHNTCMWDTKNKYCIASSELNKLLTMFCTESYQAVLLVSVKSHGKETYRVRILLAFVFITARKSILFENLYCFHYKHSSEICVVITHTSWRKKKNQILPQILLLVYTLCVKSF